MLDTTDLAEFSESPVEPVSSPSTEPGDIDSAIAAMRKITMADKRDGSRRLFAYCCRAREFGLSDAQTIAAVRLMAIERPFPKTWDDEEIRTRWLQAAQTVDVGSELSSPSICDSANRTDAGNARRFAKKYGDRVRWCDLWKKWLIWNGRCWEPDDTLAIEGLGKECNRELWGEASKVVADANAPPPLKKEVISHAKSSNSAMGIRNMLSLARSELAVKPELLDTDHWLLNAKNGTIDLRTGELRPHSRDDLITKCIDVEFDPKAQCPLFMAFLGRTFDNKAALIDFIRRLGGYCLTGSTKEQILTVFHGGGSNGKSTLLITWLQLLAGYAAKGAEGLLTSKRGDSHPTELCDLHGRRLVCCNETEFGSQFAEARIKDLTGGDTIKARRMREDFWSFLPTHKLIISTNHRPAVRGTDHAIWRRLRLVPFTVTIPDDQQDKFLTDKLKTELPGILAWLVQGCLEWQRSGLTNPPEVVAATEQYRQAEDVVGTFLAECCEQTTGASETAGVLLDSYREFSGDRSMSQKRFGKLLADRGFTNQRIKSGPLKGRWEWLGLRVASQGTDETVTGDG